MKNYLFNCYSLSDVPETPYDNIYIFPYNIPDVIINPYEVLIKDVIKAEKYDPNLFVPKIQVYTESLCPDCVNFITKSFKDFYEKVKKPNLLDIEFIPFGNAKEVYNISTKKYDFTCQHGENECYGNLVETCVIQILGRVKSYSAIICIESNFAKYDKNFDKTLEYCLSNDEKSINEEATLVQDNSKININTASVEELTTLSGIGSSKAEAIISYRTNNGNFNSIEEIKNVSGLGDALFEKIKNSITV